jgi:hypothetical protein
MVRPDDTVSKTTNDPETAQRQEDDEVRKPTNNRIPVSTAELSLAFFLKAQPVRHHGDNGVPVAVLEAEQLWTVRFQKAEKE